MERFFGKAISLFSAFLFAVFLSVGLSACGGGGGGDSSSGSGASTITAPAPSVGDTYKMTITSGTYPFASTGSYTVYIPSLNTYALTGDGNNVANSSGTYTYTIKGNEVIMNGKDSGLGAVKFNLIYTSPTSGTFIVTDTSEKEQLGSFMAL